MMVISIKSHWKMHYITRLTKIISVASLVDSFDNDHGTSTETSRHSSVFYWDFNKHCKNIVHNTGIIPEISVHRVYPILNTFVTTLHWFSNWVNPICFLLKILNLSRLAVSSMMTNQHHASKMMNQYHSSQNRT